MSEVLFVSAALRRARREWLEPRSDYAKNRRAAELLEPDLLPTCPRCGDLGECWQERCACGAKLT